MTISPPRRWNWYSELTGAAAAAQILDIIINSREGISRTELARITGLSRSTISQHIDKLAQEGLLVESGTAESRGGRKAQLLHFKKDDGHIISVDLGATSLSVGLCNLVGELQIHDTLDSTIGAGPEVILARVVTMARELIGKIGVPAAIKGVGMGVPGPVEFSTGHPVAPPIMPGWDDFPVREYLEREFSCPAFVDNDVNIMTLGEQWAGVARDVDDFIFVKIGTGIGAGIVCRGRIYRGSQGCAGDIGHIGIDGVDTICSCGNKGCLEILAGAPAIARRAEEMIGQGKIKILNPIYTEQGFITCKDVGFAASNGDVNCTELIRDAGRIIGQVLAKLINFYNPSLVVIGGGVAGFGDKLLASIRETVYSRSLPLATRHLSMQRSVLGDRAGIIGAAVLVREELYNPRQVARAITENQANGQAPG